MPDLVYSENGESFNSGEFHDVAEQALDSVGGNVGDEAEVYCGEKVTIKASRYLDCYGDDILEYLNEQAYEELGEHAEGWLNNTPQDITDELSRMIQIAVDAWAGMHGLQPEFGKVKNVRGITVKLTDDNGGYEVIC